VDEPQDEYAPIATIYDRWCAEVTEDVPFYLAACADASLPVIEIGAGTGRIAIPLANAGHRVIAVDRSNAMLDRLVANATAAGVADRIELVQASMLALPPLAETDRLLAPFRVLLHLADDTERAAFLAHAHSLLVPGGRFVFDVFEPTPTDIRQTNDQFLTRPSGVQERARWDQAASRVDLDVVFRHNRTTMRLYWVSGQRWRTLLTSAGLRVVDVFAGFAGESYHGQRGDSAWIVERPARSV
jgi:SAM-dependent methyltransferase